MAVELMPEPPAPALVLIGSEDNETVYLRDDRGLKPDDLHRWFPLLGDDEGEARTWVWLAEREPVELVRRPDADRLVADARREAGITPLGEHLKEPGGWCRTHSIQHSEVEWARIHDQLAEEDRRG
jgi:hypothetical protein